jgi:type IX secretion system PorP/SprF family membrane protein
MKHITQCLIFIVLSCRVSGQMISLSDQYLNNTMVINPAFAGCHDALSATLGYRNQWVGFDDAPKDIAFSLHSPVNHDRVGLGFLVSRNSFGIYNITGYTGNYAYRMELREGKLALGLGFGATVYNVSWNRLKATHRDDEVLTGNRGSAVLPDFSIGGYYYTDKYFVGFSLPGFLTHELNKSTGKYKTENNFSEYTFLLSGGYYMVIDRNLRFLPSMLVKYNPNHTPHFDFNAQLIMKDRIWVGAGYRNSKSLVGMIQSQLNTQMRMAYSYDFELGGLRNYNSGSHELALNYVFSYTRNVVGPRHF